MKSGFVLILGRPNAGKSTLTNALVGETISIVTPKAQTTRDQIRAILTDPQNGQIVLVDSPGVHKAKQGGLNAAMMAQFDEAVEGAHLIWYLVDPDSGVEHEAIVMDLVARAKIPVLLVLNKIDAQSVRQNAKRFAEFRTSLEGELEKRGAKRIETIEISGRKALNLKSLLNVTWANLPEGPAYYPDGEQLSDRPMRFFAGEKIREQLYLQLGDEMPYSCAVEITRFDEKVNPPRIEAIIHVERESQVGMVIGAKAAKIKSIGTKARESIEKLMGSKVFLKLDVKLNKDWTRNAAALEKLGYFIPKGER